VAPTNDRWRIVGAAKNPRQRKSLAKEFPDRWHRRRLLAPTKIVGSNVGANGFFAVKSAIFYGFFANVRANDRWTPAFWRQRFDFGANILLAKNQCQRFPNRWRNVFFCTNENRWTPRTLILFTEILIK